MRDPTVELDVLVVGGGIQGLSVLHELAARGVEGAFLVARDPLGAGETLHTHGYLQRGYMLPPEAPVAQAKVLAGAFAWWSRFLDDRGVRHAEGHPTYLGSPDARPVRRWEELGLPFERLERPPQELAGGHYGTGAHLYRTAERLFLGTSLVRALASGLEHRIGRGEVLALRRAAREDRVAACELRIGGRTVLLRPAFVVLAAGRENQRLLRALDAIAPHAPGAGAQEEPHLLRSVPMILVRGRGLPNASGFFLDAKLSMATHPVEGGALMSVLTPLGGHATTRDDHDVGTEPRIDPSLVQAALETWIALFPAARGLLDEGRVELSAYFGAKIDHPTGALAWRVGSAGFSNLRHVSPVVASLSRPAALEVVDELERTDCWRAMAGARRTLDVRLRELARVEVGVERRLSPEQAWTSPSAFRTAFGVSW